LGGRIILYGESGKIGPEIGRFLPKSQDIVSHWSHDRNPEKVNCKHFHSYPKLGTKEWKLAYSWIKSKPTVLLGDPEGDFKIFLLNLQKVAILV
jgi:hypothetical protein